MNESKHTIDETTLRFAIRKAIATTAYLHPLHADTPGVDALIAAILEEILRGPYEHSRLIAAAPELLAALRDAQRLCKEALPRFNWGGSALDNNAIRLLNEVPARIDAAIAKAEGREGE